MKMMIYVFFILTASTTLYPFSYDSAIYAAQKGDIKSADEQMRAVVVNAPDKADVLYDAGVLAHEMKNCNQAMAYFTRASHQADDKNMQFRSCFNAGNACVDMKELKKALEFYDKALTIEPDNEYARHNRDRVAQMLQEQEQENKQDQQKNDQQKDEQEQNQDQKNDQQNSQDQNQSGSDKNDSQNAQNQNQEQQKDESKKDSQKPDQRKDSKQGDTGKDGKHQGNKKQNQQESNADQKRDGDEDLDEKSQKADNKREKQQGKKHEKSPAKKQGKAGDEDSIASQDQQQQGHGDVSDDMSDEASYSAKASKDTSAKSDKPIDAWLVNILDEQDVQDKAMNKKLMEARIRQHGGGKNGQNNW